MTIDNRQLAPGTKLVGTYKKTTYVCEVVSMEDGETGFQVEDGRVFRSPSAAGKAVMNGISCNGWRFWSLAGGPEEGRQGEPPARTIGADNGAKRLRQIKRLPNQKGVAEGEVRWFCSGCMRGFTLPTGEDPNLCPQGHPAQVEDAFARVD